MSAISTAVGFPSEWGRDLVKGPAWEAAIAYGIDVSLLLENLRLTPTERLEKLQTLVDFHEALRTAGNTR